MECNCSTIHSSFQLTTIIWSVVPRFILHINEPSLKKSRNFTFLEPGFYYQKSKISFSLMKYIVISAYFKNDIFKSDELHEFFFSLLWRNRGIKNSIFQLSLGSRLASSTCLHSWKQIWTLRTFIALQEY